MAKKSQLGVDCRRKPPNQHKLGGDFHVLTRRATVVMANILPFAETEPTILTDRDGFLSSGGAIEAIHSDYLSLLEVSRTCQETTADQLTVD